MNLHVKFDTFLTSILVISSQSCHFKFQFKLIHDDNHKDLPFV